MSSDELGMHKPYLVYKDSGFAWLGEIPTHWDVAPLKAVLAKNDSGVWGDDFDDEGTIVLRSTEQTVDGHWQIENPARRKLTFREASESRLMKGDLVVTKSSGSELHIGKTTIVNEEVEILNAAFSNFMQRLRLRANETPNFYWYLLNSPVAREQFGYFSTTTTGLGNLNGTIVGNLTVPRVPLPEQQAIGRFLDHKTSEIDALIAAKQRLITLLQEKRAALITTAVTKGLDTAVPMKDSGIEWIGQIPEHWEIRQNKQLFNEIDERTETGDEELLTVSHITGVTRRSEKEVTMFEPLSYEGYKTCDAGDLVINTMWAWMGALGIAKERGMVSPSYNVYRFQDDVLESRFYDYFSRTDAHICDIVRHSKGIWKSRLRLYPDEFMDIVTPVLPLDEQREISDFLEVEEQHIDLLIQTIREAIERLTEYRTALISAAVTGKIDVRDTT